LVWPGTDQDVAADVEIALRTDVAEFLPGADLRNVATALSPTNAFPVAASGELRLPRAVAARLTSDAAQRSGFAVELGGGPDGLRVLCVLTFAGTPDKTALSSFPAMLREIEIRR
jgi:hypothetical protein